MRTTWIAIRPGLQGTRVLGLTHEGQTLMKARLRTSPVHPRAVTTLLEAIALWEGEAVRGVLVAGAEATSCGTTLFRECFGDCGRPPLYELEYAFTNNRERVPRGRDPLGSFADIRQLFAVDDEAS